MKTSEMFSSHTSLMCCLALAVFKSGLSTSTKQKLTLYLHGVSWNDAKTVCENNGGSLLKITTSTKQYFLEQYLANEWSTHLSGDVWIGLHEIDPLDGSNMQWVGCEDPIYRNFAVPDPSSTPDDSKCFTVDFTGQWKSERCDQKFGFVCEENMGQCDFDRMYPGTGCGVASPQKSEVTLSDCLNNCRNIPIQPGGEECWGVGFYLNYAQEDCWMFLTVDPEACAKNNFQFASIDMYIKTCFTQTVNSTVVSDNSNSLSPESSCLIQYSTSQTEVASVSTSTLPDVTTQSMALEKTSPQYSTETCFCPCETNSTLSLEEVLARIKRELTVDKKETSAYIRTKTCAEDDRRSSQFIGFGGIVFIAIEIGLFILLDFPFQTEKLFTMAKNTGASKFRKVNVDEYDEENFQDNEDSDVGVVGPNENEVTNFLNQSKNVEALKAVLQNPLQGCRDKRLKDKVVQLVVRVLTAFKASDIEKGVNALDSQTLDILMKYIYRGFEFPSEGSSAALLSWHEKVYAKGGAGCIIRVLTDRKSV